MQVVEPMGSISYVYIQPVDRSHDQPFVVEVDGQRPIAEGQRYHAHFPLEDCSPSALNVKLPALPIAPAGLEEPDHTRERSKHPTHHPTIDT